MVVDHYAGLLVQSRKGGRENVEKSGDDGQSRVWSGSRLQLLVESAQPRVSRLFKHGRPRGSGCSRLLALQHVATRCADYVCTYAHAELKRTAQLTHYV